MFAHLVRLVFSEGLQGSSNPNDSAQGNEDPVCSALHLYVLYLSFKRIFFFLLVYYCFKKLYRLKKACLWLTFDLQATYLSSVLLAKHRIYFLRNRTLCLGSVLYRILYILIYGFLKVFFTFPSYFPNQACSRLCVLLS